MVWYTEQGSEADIYRERTVTNFDKSRDTSNSISGGAKSHCIVQERASESRHKVSSISDLFI